MEKHSKLCLRNSCQPWQLRLTILIAQRSIESLSIASFALASPFHLNLGTTESARSFTDQTLGAATFIFVIRRSYGATQRVPPWTPALLAHGCHALANKGCHPHATGLSRSSIDELKFIFADLKDKQSQLSRASRSTRDLASRGPPQGFDGSFSEI
jgi:hypothetical protein